MASTSSSSNVVFARLKQVSDASTSTSSSSSAATTATTTRQATTTTTTSSTERPASLLFYASCDVSEKVRFRANGLLPGWRASLSPFLLLRGRRRHGIPVALRVRATLVGLFGGEGEEGQELCPPMLTPPVDVVDSDVEEGDNASISSLLTFPVAYSDLPADAVLRLEVLLLSVGGSFENGVEEASSSSSTTTTSTSFVVAEGEQRLFSRRGALKAGEREVELLPVASPTATKQEKRCRPSSSSPCSSRSLLLRARRLARGDLGRIPWLDGKALEAAAREIVEGEAGNRRRASVAEALAAAEAATNSCSAPLSRLALSITLPCFGGGAAVVLYSDPRPSEGSAAAASAAAAGAATAASAAAEGALSEAAASADAAAAVAGAAAAAATAAVAAAASLPSTAPYLPHRQRALRPLFDPETGLDSPAELKASLLASLAAEEERRRGRGGGGAPTPSSTSSSKKKNKKKKSSSSRSFFASAFGDGSARPDATERAAIEALLWQPPGAPLAAADRDLLWRFRWHLVAPTQSATTTTATNAPPPPPSEDRSRTLALVLRAAMSMPGSGGRHLPRRGEKAPSDDDDESEVSALVAAAAAAASPSSPSKTNTNVVPGALALLGPELSALPQARRRAADIVLREASDDEIELYLLFLVQALRFERGGASGDGDGKPSLGPLADALVARAAVSPRLAVALHWHLLVEFRGADSKDGVNSGGVDPAFGARAAAVHARLRDELEARASQGTQNSSPPSAEAEAAVAAASAMREQTAFVGRVRSLASGPVSAGRNAAAKTKLLVEALKAAASGGSRSSGGGGGAVDGLVVASSSSSSTSSSASNSNRVLLSPVDPSTALLRVCPERCAVFRSALAPLLLSFDSVKVVGGRGNDVADDIVSAPSVVAAARRALSESPHPSSPPTPPPLTRSDIIYKKGDDLRQDALVIALLRVADAALKRQGLDLRLTPYRVLPTSSDDGLIEVIRDAPALSTILQRHGSVPRYLASVSPCPGSPKGIDPRVLDNYTRSLAGWAAVVYALGIGDRHADNVLVAGDGRVCHIDFGFILGRDPKPWGAPPLRLARELLEPLEWPGGGGVGGGTATAVANEGGETVSSPFQPQPPPSTQQPPPQSSSESYDRFLALACEAFGVLRSPTGAAPALVSALHLASRCSAMPDIARFSNSNSHQSAAGAVLFVADRLRRGDPDGETAARALADAISEGAAAIVPAIMEKAHQFAQSWR